MKLKKFLALMLALISVLALCTGCGFEVVEEESTPAETEVEELPFKEARAHLIFMDIDGKVIYSSEEEDDEIYLYSSQWLDPTILNFVEDYCYMNDDKLGYKIDTKTNTLKTITIKDKKGDIDYAAGDKKYTNDSGKKVDTYWLCYVNGKELETQIDTTMVEDGSTIILRLVYVGQDIKL